MSKTISSLFNLHGYVVKKIAALKKFPEIESGARIEIEGKKDNREMFLLQEIFEPV